MIHQPIADFFRRVLLAFVAPWLPALLVGAAPWPGTFDPDSIPGHAVGVQQDAVIPGELIIDPPTLESLGFRWYIEGDLNRNAAVTVAYRRYGVDEWQEGLPLMRVHHEIAGLREGRYFRTGNLFAGSVLFLEPGTEYEVLLTLTDPDGGAPSEPVVLRAMTREPAAAYSGGRELHVYPPADRPSPAGPLQFDDLNQAWAAAQPGDVIFMHSGVHPLPSSPLAPPIELPPAVSWGERVPDAAVYRLAGGGAEGKPIVIRGASAAASVIEGRDYGTDLFDLAEARHVVFEDLTIRTGHTAFRGGGRGQSGGASITVRRCVVEDVLNGIWMFSEHANQWTITDNVIIGIDAEWHPRTRPGRTHVEDSHTGVNLYGPGHVVAYNRIKRFKDCVAIADFGPPPSDLHLQPVSIDIYNNELSHAKDDTIEADYGYHNIRIYENLVYNTFTALSVQPAYGGPIYLIRNVAYGVTVLPWKLNNHPAGVVAYHNTTIGARAAFNSPPFSNSHFLNNLFIGQRSMLVTGTFTPDRITLDHNGYAGTNVHWWTGPDQRTTFRSLKEFTESTGLEANGIEISHDVFVNAPPVEEGRTYCRDEFDLRLRAGSAPIGAGIRIPGIRQGPADGLPDIGAYQSGQPVPHYGPRLH